MVSKTIRLREDWLRRVADAFAPHIEKATGVPLPPFRASCGFVSGGKRSKAVAECWSATASKDKHAEIFIKPTEDDARQVASHLAHELIHAALPEAGHKKPFQKAAAALGFKAPWRSTPETDAFWAWVDPILAEIGPYPHAELMMARPVAGPKKQTARMIKVECSECGYTARVARKWLAMGAPHCPSGHGEMFGALAALIEDAGLIAALIEDGAEAEH